MPLRPSALAAAPIAALQHRQPHAKVQHQPRARRAGRVAAAAASSGSAAPAAAAATPAAAAKSAPLPYVAPKFTAAREGSPEPLGPSRLEGGGAGGVNFALYSGGATRVALVLHDPATGQDEEVPMTRTGEQSKGGWAGALVALLLPLLPPARPTPTTTHHLRLSTPNIQRRRLARRARGPARQRRALRLPRRGRRRLGDRLPLGARPRAARPARAARRRPPRVARARRPGALRARPRQPVVGHV